MSIDWISLVKVALVSLAFGIGVVAVYSAGVFSLASARRVTADEGLDSTLAGRTRLAAAGLCFFACILAVLYGLYLIIPQFHQ